ncbi:MAG: hypothetical protein ACOYXC_20440 [Candidatus Rifleibacteriota bacterium]
MKNKKQKQGEKPDEKLDNVGLEPKDGSETGIMAEKTSAENEAVEAAQESNSNEQPEIQKSRFWGLITSIWKGLIFRQFFQKIFTLLFAVAVFGAFYFYLNTHRPIMTYMGIMLLMVIVYAEILIIRDHLWVIEGSMRESRKWRDVFFNQTNLRRQRIRKILVMLFALGIFSYVYMKSITSYPGNSPVLSFFGIILMITILYYEILTIRDEVFIMLQSIQASQIEIEKKTESQHEKFLKENEAKSDAEKVS